MLATQLFFKCPQRLVGAGVRSSNRQLCHLIIQIKNELVMQTAETEVGRNSHRSVRRVCSMLCGLKGQ